MLILNRVLQNSTTPIIVIFWRSWCLRLVIDIALFPQRISELCLDRSDPAGIYDVGGGPTPWLEADETELCSAASTGHMTAVGLLFVTDEQATFRTGPDARTVRNTIDFFLFCKRQDAESRVLPIASFVSATFDSCTCPLP